MFHSAQKLNEIKLPPYFFEENISKMDNLLNLQHYRKGKTARSSENWKQEMHCPIEKSCLLYSANLPEIARNCHVDTICNASGYYRHILNFTCFVLINSLPCIDQGICHSCPNLIKNEMHYVSSNLEIPKAKTFAKRLSCTSNTCRTPNETYV